MFKNYLTIAFRNILKQKTYSLINIAGLAIGIACCILILLFVNDELNYDKFHKNYENIYRACLDSRIGNSELNAAVTPAPMAEALVKDFPQVKAAAKFTGFSSYLLRYKDKVFNEENFFWTDSKIFDVLTFEFVKGEAKNALNQPNTIVITEKMAHKYFGNEEPIGKLLNVNNEVDILVTGVVKGFPANSHFHFDFLSSFVGQIESNHFWFRNSFYTYFVLQDGIDHKEFESQMNNKFIDYTSPEIIQATGLSMEDNIKQGFRYQFLIQPLADIHLKSDFDYEIEPNSDITYVYNFSIIAFGILLIAIVNFMNLSTAKSSGRAKEVGIRKTLGSSFNQLIQPAHKTVSLGISYNEFNCCYIGSCLCLCTLTTL
jgi:putative ABC transport system permease protein